MTQESDTRAPGALVLRTDDNNLEHVTGLVERLSRIVVKKWVAVTVKNSDGGDRPGDSSSLSTGMKTLVNNLRGNVSPHNVIISKRFILL